MNKISIYDHPIIAKSYRYLTPVIELARFYGVSRQAIYDILKSEKAEVSKIGKTVCSWCGKEVKRPKSRLRGKKRVFCEGECYWQWMEAGGNSPDHKLTRSLVGMVFDLEDEMVVHYEDGIKLNNMLRNLKVFRNQDEHMKWHFDKSVDPIWEGE